MTTSQVLLLRRGSGRKLKRPGISRETLHYAIAFVLFSQHMAFHLGGKPRQWMTRVGEEAAAKLLRNSQAEISDWLTYWLLDIPQNADTTDKPD
jgi:hypothetical protein